MKLGLQMLAAATMIVALLLALGAMQWFGWLSSGSATSTTAIAGDANAAEYTCAMHPQIRQPNPGRCPICGMALEPVTQQGANKLDEYAVQIEPAHRRLANIETAAVQRQAIHQTISAVGAIAVDESRMATISAYVAGRIERLFADYTGVIVAQGDHLGVLYSPELYAAQVEYLQSRQALGEMGSGSLPAVRRTQERLLENSRQKLVELGMTPRQIAELENSGEPQSRLTIYSPIGGTVIEKPAVEGKYVEVGEPIYRIADLSTVWLMLQLYPEDAARIRFGQIVEAEVQSLPGEGFQGRVAFVSPVVDERTRTTGVRVEMLNPDGKLRPGDYARAKIRVPLGDEGEVYDADLAGKWISPMHPQIIREEAGNCPICGMALVPTSRYGFSDVPLPQPTALVVPRSAVLMAGENSLVYVETEPGRFEIRPVRLGPVLRNQVVLIDGVEEGEMVATSGNFLIDSQMQLAGKPSLIDPTRAIVRGKNEQQQEQPGPLELEVAVEPLPGEAGQRLEELYRAYFALQETLAKDRVPEAKEVEALRTAAQALLQRDDLPAELREWLPTIVDNSEHLHHLELDDARQHFKPVSHAVVRLAARYRGSEADAPFVHFWCSMVKGGGGDWLQATHPPANPYWGSEMLRCVQHEQTLPLAGSGHTGHEHHENRP